MALDFETKRWDCAEGGDVGVKGYSLIFRGRGV